MIPLLELVDHEQDLVRSLPDFLPRSDQCGTEIEVGGQVGVVLPQSSEQSGFSLLACRLDVDGDDRLGQAREQTGFDEGRLAAAARAEDVVHPEGLVRVHLFDPNLPEMDGFGEPVATARTGQQFEEEVFVLGIE